MNVDDIRTMQDLDGQVEKLEDQIKTLKQRREKVHQRVVDSFEREGVQNVRVDGRTFYLRRDVWARPKKGLGPALVALLASDDRTEDLVAASVTPAKLAAYVREQIAAHDDDPTLSTMDAKRRAAVVLPAALLALLEVDETYTIRSQKVPTSAKTKS